jgi:hypothetical protein
MAKVCSNRNCNASVKACSKANCKYTDKHGHCTNGHKVK